MAVPFATIEITCAQCGKVATRYIAGGNPARYCGNACKVAAYKASHPKLVAVRRANEDAKRKAARRSRVRVVVRMNVRKKAKPDRRCPDCGASLLKGSHRCPPCATARRRALTRQAPSRRADKQRRKAMMRGKLSGAERFDPLEIFVRDGWRCHICGVPTPKRLRGSYDDRAPELDHIMPLAAGGQHTRINTACACRKCNIAKGARTIGQLRLVA